MKRFFTTCLLVATVMTMMAVPAKRGVFKTLTLADGTTVKAQLTGDEFGHCWLGADGVAYVADGNGYYVSTDAKALASRAKARRAKSNARHAKRLSQRRAAAFTGQKKGLIILVNFSDKSFNASHDNALYQRIANEPGYSEGNFKGSMVDYFKAQSMNQFELDFDIVGPVTVSNGYAYYGENDDDGNDKSAGEMVCEAVTQAKNYVTNWRQYDWDNDGEVDQIYVIYAGKGEADGGAESTIWPHAYDLSSAQYYGDGTGPVTVASGLKVNTYACGSELNGNGSISGIGTMCHEFSHCLGYPDFYDTDYSGGQGMDAWDLMDQGSYNDDGYQPAGYTSYERWVAGWIEPTVLETEDVVVDAMPDLQSSGQCYIIYNKGNRNEYFLLENRQLTGWDASLPNNGLLILHCDYDEQVWYKNEPNDDPNHQRMTVVPADGKYTRRYSKGYGYYYETADIAGDPFPNGTVKAFNKDLNTYDNIAKKAAMFFNKNSDNTNWLDSSVDSITQNNDGTIAFKFVAQYGSNSGNEKPSVDGALFCETFDECNGTGGNDGSWSGNGVANGTFKPDNNGWTAGGNKAYGADQCAKFGTGDVKGSATTPTISLSGETKLTFRAGAWNHENDGKTLLLSVSGGTISPESVTMTKGDFTEFEATVTGNGAITITFESQKGRFFLDDVVVIDPNATAINDATIRTTPNTQRNAVYALQGRRVKASQLKSGLYIIDGKKVFIR